MQTMQGFKALEVKFCENSSTSQFWFLKVHNVREKVPQKPSNKTLFVLGVPPYCNEECISKLFSTFGHVKAVFLHKAPCSEVPEKSEYKYFPPQNEIKGFKVGYVVFKRERDLLGALEFDQPLILPNELILTGVQKWNKNYNERFPNKNEMEKEIKIFMDNFDIEMNKKNEEEKALSQPQDDGWITVTRRGKKPGFARKESVAKQLMKRSERQRKKKELSNFYTFQIKQSKMKNLVALRKKFEEDKRKIAVMKEARRFKPF